jgi:hypothetical protein
VNAAAASRADDFGADLRQAIAVWPRQPLLPIISMLWWTLPVDVSGNDALLIALGIVMILFLGWPGTEREWYRRAFAGEILHPSEIWPTNRRFFGPFLRLGLLLLPVVFPLMIVYIVWYESAPVVSLFALLVLFFILDVALTFVTPALTFTTSSAKGALSVGLAMLRAHWPASAPYVLTPALIFILGAQTLLAPMVGQGGVLAATALAGLLSLALKGATVAFYLRHLPAPRA